MKKPSQSSAGTAQRPPPGRPFKPGQSGNPGGRPKTRHIREIAMERTPEAMAHLWALVQGGKGMVKLEAIRLWLAYGPGKPSDKVEHSGPDGGPSGCSSR